MTKLVLLLCMQIKTFSTFSTFVHFLQLLLVQIGGLLKFYILFTLPCRVSKVLCVCLNLLSACNSLVS